MSIFWAVIEWTMSKMKVVGAACLMGMTLLTCVDVVGRFFRHPVFGSVELVTVMATIAVAAAMPFTHKDQGHIGVEILVRVLAPKKQCMMDIFTGFLSFILFAIVTWRMTAYAADIKESGEVSLNLQLPTYVFIYFIAFCCLVFTLIILQDILGNLAKLRRGL
ncbi:MAG: TRAP transporter small permease [Deltaproteobacteria bacterium]